MKSFVVKGLLVLSTALMSMGAAAAGYPKKAAHVIGVPHDYGNPSVQANLARFDFTILNYWPGWDAWRGTTLNDVALKMKAINPQTKVFVYVLAGSVNPEPAAWAELVTKLTASQWWLYSAGVSGSPVTDSWAGNMTTNTTLFAPKDSNGDRWIDFYAKWVVKNYYQKNPAIDGFSTDTLYWQPRDRGDWNRDGVIDDPSDPTVSDWFRQGYKAYFAQLHGLMPGKSQLANIGDWGHPNAVLTNLSGQVEGGIIEGLIGFDYSVENWGGWDGMMRWYRKALNATSGPKLAIFHQVGSVTDYKSFRYGLSSALMDDGYYAFNAGPDASAYGDAPWFDEYDADLGQPTSGPSFTAWQQGVYRRDFENGIVLVNPKGNGSKTLTLETSFKKLSGKQDSSVNNGATVTTITLPDRDGIILKRLTAVKKPAAPTGLSVQ